MKRGILVGCFVAVLLTLLSTGCQSIPPGAERGPNGTMAYFVPVDASAPGARIEVNGEFVGNTPLTLKIWGDPDGTFHDFGSFTYEVRAFPLVTNQFVQTRIYGTGHLFSHEDHIPSRIYFDMSLPPMGPSSNYMNEPPVYGPPPDYYYGPPYYYGPSFRFYWGPRYYHRHWH